jgi:hypothetical protein
MQTLAGRFVRRSHRWNWISGILAVLLMLALGTRPASAQILVCSSSCPPPTVTISPVNTTYVIPTVQFTVTLCGVTNISNRSILFNGVQQISLDTLSIPPTGTCPPDGSYIVSAYQYTGTVSLLPGVNTLVASASGGVPLDTTVSSALYTLVVPSVHVTAAQSVEQALPGASVSAVFTVTNLAAGSDTFTVWKGCRGAGLTASSCDSATKTVFLAAGASQLDTVATTAATADSIGTFIVRATSHTNSAVFDSGATDVFVGPTPPVGVTQVGLTSLPAVEKDRCLIESIAPNAASACGYLRAVHPLPSVRTYTKAHTPTLLYDGGTAAPLPLLPSWYAVPGPEPRTSIRVVVGGQSPGGRRTARFDK